MKSFYHDQKEKNHTARSARTRPGGKKKYMLPSDSLSPSELKKLNGEINVYTMKEPISWTKFKSYPRDIQKEYLQWFIDEFGISAGAVSKLVGVTQSAFWAYRKNSGLSVEFPKVMSNADKYKFDCWLSQFDPDNEIKEEPVVEEPKKEKVKVVEQPVFFNTISACEMSMEGTAAEISQTLFSLFRNEKIQITVTYVGGIIGAEVV